jgi:hypothetical protein
MAALALVAGTAATIFGVVALFGLARAAAVGCPFSLAVGVVDAAAAALLARLDGGRMSAALPLSPSRGMNRVIDRPTFPPKVTVSDEVGRPLSRRSRGASEVRRPATGMPFLGVSSLDLAAPVPAGAALLLGRLFYPRACLRLQAIGRRASVCVPASSSHLLHLTCSVASMFLKHGGLTECGQRRAVAAQ